MRQGKNKNQETSDSYPPISNDTMANNTTVIGTEDSKNLISVVVRLNSFNIFERCIKRAQNLINFHQNNIETNEEQLNDAYRAAIVLSISALDAFIRSIVLEKINSILVDSKKKLPDKLANYIKDLLNQDKLLDAARMYNLQEVVDKHIKEDFETKSFQGEWKIKSFMALIGYENIFQAVSSEADINEKNLISKIEIYTKRRHVIAHTGDYDLNSTSQVENNIKKEFAQECVDLVSKFAKHVNEICQKTMKQLYIVTYDLATPGLNYEALVNKIKGFPDWARLGSNSYMLFSEKIISK